MLRCDLSFLSPLAEKVNLSYRYHGAKQRGLLAERLSSKFDTDTVDTIVKMYLLCYDAEDVARAVRPDGMDDIVRAIPDLFGSGEYLYEVSLGRHICDVVLLRAKEVVAIEVKSEADNIVRAVNQLAYYKLWANRVYLAYAAKHGEKVIEVFASDEIGLLKYEDGGLTMKRKAPLSFPDGNTLLRFATYEYLQTLTRSCGIEAKGTKKEMANRLSRSISRERTQRLFRNFLREKSVNRDRGARRSVEIAQICPLGQFLRG